jgi:hypothetical protein
MEVGFLDLFTKKKPVIGVVHLRGTVLDNVMSHVKHEINVYLKHGVDGILFDNYSGNFKQLEIVLEYIRTQDIEVPIGVHVLHVDALSFHLANKFKLEFLQVDALVGDGSARDEESMQVFFDLYRENCHAKVIGGIRLPKNYLLAGKALSDDLDVAMNRYDAMLVRGNQKGVQLNETLQWFGQKIDPFPRVLIDMNEEHVMGYIDLWDAVIIDSAFKDAKKRTGYINDQYVATLMDEVHTYRANLP